MNNKYYTVQEKTREKFYRLPKVFFTSDKYKKLPNDVKMAYAILQDRLQLSIKNKWIDEKTGRIYFIYSNAKLQEILNVGKNYITKVKKLLVEAELLEIQKRYHNQTDILFLLKPEVTTDDIYQIEQQENDVEPSHDGESLQEGTRNPSRGEPGIPPGGNPESLQEGPNDTEYFSYTELNNTELSENDMLDVFHNDYNNHTNLEDYNDYQSNQTNHSYNNFDKNNSEDQKHMLLYQFPEMLQIELKVFRIQEIRLIIGTLLKAKKNAENNWGTQIDYRLETHDLEISKIVNALRIKLKQNNETVETMQPYFMRMLQNYFTKRATESMYDDGITNTIDYHHNY